MVRFRAKKDVFANYFRFDHGNAGAPAFLLSLRQQFSDYSADLWGISASDSKNGYVGMGRPIGKGTPIGPVDGSIVPCATAGSLPFVFCGHHSRASMDSRHYRKPGSATATSTLQSMTAGTTRM